MKFSQLILFLILSANLHAQSNRYLDRSEIALSCSAKGIELSALEIEKPDVRNLENVLGLTGLQFEDKSKDQYGSVCIDYRMMENNIPVYNGLIKVLYDTNKKLVSIHGKWLSNGKTDQHFQLTADEVRLINEPLLLKRDLRIKDDSTTKRPIYTPYWYIQNESFIPIWEVKYELESGLSIQVFFDDNNKEIKRVLELDNTCDFSSVNTAHYGTRTLETSNLGNSSPYYSINDCASLPYDIEVYNNNGLDNNILFTAELFESSDSLWADSDEEIVGGTTLWALTEYAIYLDSVHGRSGWDNANSGWLAYANTLIGLIGNNAQYKHSNQSFNFGLGDIGGTPADDWNTIDIVGHEVTHGIDDSEGSLEYEYESGALDESFADIFGESLEEYVLGLNDWQIGSDFGAIRSFSDPLSFGDPSVYQGTNWFTGSSDNGGVHTNSSVQNHMFYLLSNGGTGINDGISYSIPGVGINISSILAYKVLTDLVTSSTDYNLARDLWLSAATSLYPNNPAIYDNVEMAWCAVGIGDQCENIMNVENGFSVENITNIHPNPSAGTYFVIGKNFNLADITVYDVNGVKLTPNSISFENQRLVLDISSFSDGVYFLHLEDDAYRKVFKMIKSGIK